MYLYHYPDIWYDYATWHSQNGSPDSAAVVFQRALKALPGRSGLCVHCITKPNLIVVSWLLKNLFIASQLVSCDSAFLKCNFYILCHMSRIPWDVWYEDVHVSHWLVYTDR